jgi:hypothetical protein
MCPIREVVWESGSETRRSDQQAAIGSFCHLSVSSKCNLCAFSRRCMYGTVYIEDLLPDKWNTVRKAGRD